MTSRPAQIGTSVAFGVIAAAGLTLILWAQLFDDPADDRSESLTTATVPSASAAGGQSPADESRRDATPHWLALALDGAHDFRPGGAADPSGLVEGRLAWQSSGMPVVGARVTLTQLPLDTIVPPDDLAEEPATPGAPSTVTDYRGFFFLEDVPRRDSWFLRFEKEHLVEVRPLRRLPDDDATRTWQGEYRVAEQGTLTGRIVDETGAPLGDVRVRAVDDPMFDHAALPPDVRLARRRHLEAFDPIGNREGRPLPSAVERRDRLLPFAEGRTDSEGHFEIRGVRAGRIDLVIQAEHHRGTLSDVPVEHWDRTDLGTIPIAPVPPLTVEVVDREERPVDGISVAVHPSSHRFGPPPARTDSEGRVTFHVGDPEAIPFDGAAVEPAAAVHVQRQPGGPWEPLGWASAPETRLVLEPLTAWRCRVRTSEGEPVPGVHWRSLPELPGLIVEARTDGEYLLSGLPSSVSVLLIAIAPGHAPAAIFDPTRLTSTTLRAAGRIDEVTVYPTLDVTIRVVDEGNEPVHGVRVFAEIAADDRHRLATGVDWLALGPVPIGATDAEGTLPVAGLWSASTTFLIEHPDFGQHFAARIEPEDGAEYVLRVDRWASIQGAITTDFERIDRRLSVVAFHAPFDPDAEQSRPPVATVSTVEGIFELPRLTPGRWILRVLEPVGTRVSRYSAEPQPRIWAEQEVVLGPGTDLHHVILELEPPAPPDFSGVIRIAEEPRPGLRVRLLDPDSHVHLETETDGAGEFAFVHEQWRDALVQVAVQHHGYWTVLATLEIPRDGDDRPVDSVDIDVAVGGLVLDVRTPTGAALSNRLLCFTDIDTGNRMVLVTDDSGRAVCDAVPPGLWRIEVPTASEQSRFVIDETVGIDAGEWRELEVQAVARPTPP